MFLIAEGTMFVVMKFLQILLWISIPALLIAMLITTLIHFNKKRKKSKTGDEQSGMSEIIPMPNELVPIISSFNSKKEVNEFIKHISRSQAKYIAMRKDFEKLSEKYHRLQTEIHQRTIKNETMEHLHPDLQQTIREQVDTIRQQHELEKKELMTELNQLNSSFENLERDNSNLREQLSAYSQGGTGLTATIQKWEEEKNELKKRIAEQEYLRDVIEEKKSQISFLQQQLEQRIKNHHMVEQQFRELGIKLMEAREELEIKQQSNKEFQSVVHDKEQEIIFLKEMVQSRSEQGVQMEAKIKELQELTEKLSFELEDKDHSFISQQNELTGILEQKKELEKKLERDQILFKGLHRKLTDILEEQLPESPVIVMKPMYQDAEEEQLTTESAIQ